MSKKTSKLVIFIDTFFLIETFSLSCVSLKRQRRRGVKSLVTFCCKCWAVLNRLSPKHLQTSLGHVMQIMVYTDLNAERSERVVAVWPAVTGCHPPWLRDTMYDPIHKHQL